MKITGFRTFTFFSRHRNARRNWLLVELSTDEGLTGLGEASLLAHEDKVAALMKDWFEEYLKGKDPLHTEVHWMRLYYDDKARGGPIGATALSGIDIALWDIKGKALGKPVYELLGGPFHNRIRVYANGWYTNPGTPEQNAQEAKLVVGKGYTALKFDPFGREAYYTISPKEAQLAEDRVAAVREAVGPNVDILVEAHARWNVHTAIQIGLRLERYKPFWYEEPCSYENVSETAEVRRRVNVPIATGERLHYKFPFAQLVEARAADFLQPDIANAGGITELKKIAAIAEPQHILVAPHNTNSPVGTVASFHLGASCPNFAIQEYHAEFYEPLYFDIVSGLTRQKEGYVPLPGGPGLGVTLNEDVVKAHPYQKLTWSHREI
jgi:galactonate dehydratase